MRFRGKPMDRDVWKAARRDIQIVFQDPFGALDPRMPVSAIIAEPLRIQRIGSPADRRARAAELVEQVGLPLDALNRYPHEFSGGQRQRIAIARALAPNPALIVADEPLSALDVSIQSQVLNLMKELQEQFGLSYLFISHDLAVVNHLVDRVAVLYLGRLVEVRRAGKPVRDAVPPLHPGAAGSGAADRPQAPARPHHPRRDAEPAGAAARLRLPSALPQGAGCLPRSGAGTGTGAGPAGAVLRMPLQGLRRTMAAGA